MVKLLPYLIEFDIFDIFGEQINILQKHREKYKTPLGAVISLVIIGVTGFSLINLITDMYQQQSPNVIFKIEH